MSVDWDKPLMTRSGHPARLLAKINADVYPYIVVVEEDGKEVARTYMENGSEINGFPTMRGEDIINRREPHKHADVLRAYADGYTILGRSNRQPKWGRMATPGFSMHWEYAVEEGQGYDGPAQTASVKAMLVRL